VSARFVHVGGRFIPYREASVSVEDRGLQFGDSIYEVWSVLDGRLADAEAHLVRLGRNLRRIGVARPMGDRALTAVLREALRRNRVRDGLVYLQVTRGAARRDHFIPEGTKPSLIVIARAIDMAKADAKARAGVAVATLPDERWARCDLKTTNLLPNVLGKEAAKAAGAAEAWLVDEAGFVTEGASTTAWMVDGDGALVTRPNGPELLPGVTRERLIALAGAHGLKVVERLFTPEEARGARELFMTSASAFVTPVVRIDGAPVGDGRPGPVASRLRDLYLEQARNTAL